jgi:hypothetical protein
VSAFFVIALLADVSPDAFDNVVGLLGEVVDPILA